MPRQVRIEFPGAFYHVMARGNRLQPIFASGNGKDQELFLKTLGEACERSGFRIWAWVLMENHYHLVLETPKPNLVAGMTWFQNTYTRRFNTRHKAWGRLFGDRYKSILVDDDRQGGGSSYLASLLDYVHLNPARAGLVARGKKGADSVLDYPWSSVGRGYALAPKKRPKWLVADAGLELFGLEDTTRDRRRLVERLDGRMNAEEAEKCGVAEIDGQTLNSTLRRGWYWGSEQFKEAMLDELEKLAATKRKAGEAMPASGDYSAGSQAKDHDSQHAEEIIARAIEHFGLQQGKDNRIRKAAYGDLSVVATAWAICRERGQAKKQQYGKGSGKGSGEKTTILTTPQSPGKGKGVRRKNNNIDNASVAVHPLFPPPQFPPMDFLPAGEIIGDRHQVRTITLKDSPQLADGEYRFVDFYCTNKKCDCRKTIIQIHHNGRHVSTVNYGWEKPKFYIKWMGGDDEIAREMSGLSIDFASPDLLDRSAVLALMNHLLDKTWIERIKSHYRMVRQAAKPPQNVVPFEPKISRNAPCPCGSGNKYKKCCARN